MSRKRTEAVLRTLGFKQKVRRSGHYVFAPGPSHTEFLEKLELCRAGRWYEALPRDAARSLADRHDLDLPEDWK